MFSITTLCESPMPSVSRPPDAACVVSACGGEHHRVPRVRRDDAGAELDARHLAPDDRQHGERVDPEDLRDPVPG